MVQSLSLIALAACFQQASSITDVGATPYHLILPVLRRLNAKQLSLLEENSPDLTPDSDDLWALLIEKDFPDRPQSTRRNLLQAKPMRMPNKELYMQYSKDRENFLEGSAQRLRRITQKLQREKSKNSIVPINGIIAEPVIRRRTLAVPRPVKPASKYSNNSIMGKAFKDVQNRLLMFGPSKRHDPYAAFNTNRIVQRPKIGQRPPAQRPVPSPVPSTSVASSNSESSNLQKQWSVPPGHGIYLLPPPPSISTVTSSNMKKCDSRESCRSPTESSATRPVPDTAYTREVRKRKAQSPLLESRRRTQRPKRLGLPGNRSLSPKNQSEGVDHQNKRDSLAELSTYPKSIRSSIFN